MEKLRRPIAIAGFQNKAISKIITGRRLNLAQFTRFSNVTVHRIRSSMRRTYCDGCSIFTFLLPSRERRCRLIIKHININQPDPGNGTRRSVSIRPTAAFRSTCEQRQPLKGLINQYRRHVGVIWGRTGEGDGIQRHVQCRCRAGNVQSCRTACD